MLKQTVATVIALVHGSRSSALGSDSDSNKYRLWPSSSIKTHQAWHCGEPSGTMKFANHSTGHLLEFF